MKLKRIQTLKRLSIVFFLLVGIFFLIDYLQEPLFVNNYRKSLDSETFIKLSRGVTRYELNLIDTSQIVLFIHGGGILGYEVFRENIDALNKAGFSTLAYDQYGRGYSDKPRIDYTSEELYAQLSELLDSLKITDKRISIISLSMGSIVALQLLNNFSGKISKQVFISPSLFKNSSQSIVLKVPMVNYILMTLYWRPKYIEKRKKEFVNNNSFKDYSGIINHFSKFRGFKRVYLKTWLNVMSEGISFTSLDPLMKKKLSTNTLYIFGQNDPFLGPEYRNPVSSNFQNAEILIIDSCGHLPNYEKVGLVNSILIDFIEN